MAVKTSVAASLRLLQASIAYFGDAGDICPIRREDKQGVRRTYDLKDGAAQE
jgi:hypothetical protein